MRTQRKRRKEHAKELVRTSRTFLEDLISLRSASKMTQGDVAELMGVSQSAVSQFEHYDSNPTLASIRRYALAVGADLVLEARPRAVTTSKPAVQRGHVQVRVSAVEGFGIENLGAPGINWTERKAEHV